MWAVVFGGQPQYLAYFQKPVALFDNLSSRNSSCNIRMSNTHVSFFCPTSGYVAVNPLDTFIESNQKISANKAITIPQAAETNFIPKAINIVGNTSVGVMQFDPVTLKVT